MLQRVTERTFYGVPPLSGLPIRKTLQDCQAAAADCSPEHAQILPSQFYVYLLFELEV